MCGKTLLAGLALPALLLLTACGAPQAGTPMQAAAAEPSDPAASASELPEMTESTGSVGPADLADPAEQGPETDPASPTAPAQPAAPQSEEETDLKAIQLSINGQAVGVTWEQNEAVAALKDILADGPLTVTAEPYGGFEVVGALGRTLPANDMQITTAPGDIVLYIGDHIVLFHGSNTWAYTRLGHIEDLDADALRALLGGGNTALVLALA